MTEHILYIAGPMAGIPYHNFPQFESAAFKLRTAGYTVISPHEIKASDGSTHGVLSWAEYLKADLIVMLRSATALAMLSFWEDSHGACLEYHIAETLGWPIKSVDFWLQKARGEVK